ncbi:PREDICTED: ATM interactor [Nanorana parkeri]|uniref:ATM interactor n=1 Tax=Nanorana parkeri TaxID=125878 RepID=UPI0008549124|nr:PREDICTED: ATM interactor [Nanorana parkeri]
MTVRGGATVRALYSCEHWEIVKPSVSELSREVRTNILCTVKGCGKVLPNPPALNMHLVKSHGVQEGISNPTLRKDLKASQKLYCCPVEGCPRGMNRPFSQFSRVKQHFMKMHAEKKHKCDKCGSSYGTEWDLKRHIGYCGKTFKCTCGCPYTSRTALLSHTHRMGHEVPIEHRDPPVKKRKLDALKQNQKTVNEDCIVRNYQPEAVTTSDQQMAELKALPASESCIASYVTRDTHLQPNQVQKLLLPKPKLTVVKLPVMQLAHLPVLVSASDCPMKPVMVAVNSRGPVISTLQFIPHYNGTVLQNLGTETTLSSNLSHTSCLGAANSYVQVSMEKLSPTDSHFHGGAPKGKITSDVQTDLSYFTPSILSGTSWTTSDSSVSSSAQTDLSFTAQMSLPISVETQTLQDCSSLPPKSSSEVSVNPCLSCGISRETQTSSASLPRENPLLVDQAVNCDNLFSNTNSFYTVSTQTSQPGITYIPGTLGQNLLNTDTMKDMRVEEMKAPSFINFSTQNGTFPSQNMTDNQTQTMELLSDLEKMLSDNMSSQPLDNRNLLSAGESHLSSNCNTNTGIDFDIDEFFSASNIQTQTEESMLSNLNSEYLDIETQTDFLFSNDSTQSFSNKGSSNLLVMEMFDTQTQTDLNLFLDRNSPLRLGSLLKQSSFSISTDSSDAESHTDGASTSKNALCAALEGHVQQNSAQTQTTDSCFETLGSLFLTSNETQTAMDDFLLADLAWNTMESQFSSVETQTCEERFDLFSDKSEN